MEPNSSVPTIWKNLHSVPSTLFPTNHCQEGNLNEISSTDLRHDSAIQDINENLCDDSAFVKDIAFLDRITW